MFQAGFPSIIRSSKLHIQCQVIVRPILLPAASLAGMEQVCNDICHTGLLTASCCPSSRTVKTYECTAARMLQGVQLKSGPYLVFTKKYPFVHLISGEICGD